MIDQALDALKQRHSREVEVLLDRAEREQRRLVGARDDCLSRLDLHVVNASRSLEMAVDTTEDWSVNPPSFLLPFTSRMRPSPPTPRC